MKKWLSVFLFITIIIGLAACGSGKKQSIEGLISRGDRIGDFTYTAAEPGQFTPLWDLACVTADDGITRECTASVGANINLSPGVFGDSQGQSLEEKWSAQVYGLTVDGLPVDLQSFGPVDIQYPAVGTTRLWNVVVSTNKPGSLTFVDSGTIGGMAVNNLTTINFVEPEE